jgi:cell division protein FtsB
VEASLTVFGKHMDNLVGASMREGSIHAPINVTLRHLRNQLNAYARRRMSLESLEQELASMSERRERENREQ